MSPAPRQEPIGLTLTRTSRVVSRSFDEALAAGGASLPVWLVLMSLKSGKHGTQRDLAQAIGIEGPTLTHHLNRMEAEGLVTRRRDPDNRRIHQVSLTRRGEAMFRRLLGTVTAFDRQLRAGLGDRELSALRRTLDRLRENVTVGTGEEEAK